MRNFLLILCAALLFTACGSKSGILVKYDGKDIPFEAKSSWITSQGALYGSSVKVADERHALRWIILRNFDYQPTNALDTGGKPTADGQIKLHISLHEEPGTKPETPIKTSTFSGEKDGPMSLEFFNLTIFKDGKEESYPVSLGSQTNRKDSELKILSVTDDEITGEINFNVKAKDKELIIKGPFKAKIYKGK
ncbi:MAG TPA: hypothetical protein PKY59_17605 [Pyrinomonadaceae bacterium]|nr:hypothetical protein [Pyrinomonadaceae bacterium]